MDYHEYRLLHEQKLVLMGIGKDAAKKWVTELPTSEKSALALWRVANWALLAAAIVMLIIFLPVGLLMLLCCPFVAKAIDRSIQQAVLDHAHNDGLFFNFLVMDGSLHFRVREHSSGAPWRNVSLMAAGMVLLSCGNAVAQTGVTPAEELEMARKHAMRDIEKLAISLKAPKGAFGTRWLMTPDEVLAGHPKGIMTARDKVVEHREEGGRFMRVEYSFQGNALTYAQIVFVGKSTEANYNRSRAILMEEYGELPKATGTPDTALMMERYWEGFGLIHILANETETISVFRSKSKG